MSGPYRDDSERVRRGAELPRALEPARLVLAGTVLVLGAVMALAGQQDQTASRPPEVFSEEWLRGVSPWQPVVEGCLPRGAEPITATVEFPDDRVRVTLRRPMKEPVALCVFGSIDRQLWLWRKPLETGRIIVHVR